MVRINKSFIVFCVVCLVVALGVGAIFVMRGGEVGRRSSAMTETKEGAFGRPALREVPPLSELVEAQIDYVRPALTNGEPNGQTHRVRIPKLLGDSEAVREINEDIQIFFGAWYEVTELDRFGGWVVTIDYECVIHDGILMMIVSEDRRWDNGQGGDAGGHGYYYDIQNDRRLGWDEFLERMGMDRDSALTRLQQTAEFESEWQRINIGSFENVWLNCILVDDTRTVAWVSKTGVSGSFCLVTSSILSK